MKGLRLALILAGLLVAGIVVLILLNMKSENVHYTVYVGGYGGSAVKFDFNPKTSDYGIVGDFKVENPSYLALSKAAGFIYGVSESGRNSGVWGYSDKGTVLSLGNVKDSGADACFISLFRGHLFTANYGKGGISVYPLDTAGNIKPPVQILSFTTAASKYKVSRIHMVKFVTGKSSKNDYLLATDKGLDRIYIMRLGDDTASVSSNNLLYGKPVRLYKCDSSFVSVPEGYGPRHMEISKDGKFLYLLCETSGRLLVYSIRESGNNIVLKQVGEDGLVTRIAYQVTDRWPRSFAITPDGEFLFVCCQKDKTVQIFRIDQASGYLINTGKKISFPDLEPSCVLVRSV